MIKVNLLKTKVKPGGSAAEDQFDIPVSGFDMGDGDAGSSKDIAIKVLLMLVSVIGLYYYESSNLSDLQSKLNKTRRLNEEKTVELEGLRLRAGEADKLKLQVKRLEEKLDILSGLSKKRLKELKALDNLQNLIPSRVWLVNLKYDSELLEFQGNASTDEDLNIFVSRMEKSIYFKDIVILSAFEKTSQVAGAIKEFRLQAQLGSFD